MKKHVTSLTFIISIIFLLFAGVEFFGDKQFETAKQFFIYSVFCAGICLGSYLQESNWE